MTVLVVVLAFVLATDIGVVVARDGDRDDRASTADAPRRQTTTTTSGSSTTTTTVLVGDDATPSTTSPAPPAGAMGTTVPRTVPTTLPPTVPTSTTQAPTPTTTPSNLARVLVRNDLSMPLDVSINMGFLRVAPSSSIEVVASAELGVPPDQAPPGSDLITVSIPPDFGSPDAGCGSHRLGQLLSPGGNHLLHITASGTCQLLGGSAKPAFSVSPR